MAPQLPQLRAPSFSRESFTGSAKYEQDIQQEPEELRTPRHPEIPKQAWTFSSSGWLFCYFFGVIKCLRELQMHNNVYVIGSSGGACAGCFLFLEDADVDLDKVVEYICECAQTARSSWRHAFRITDYVRGAIERFQPADIADRIRGHMEISVTKIFPWLHNVRMRNFQNSDDVQKAILASSRVVPLAGPPLHLKELGYCMDGFFTDLQVLKGVVLGRSFFSFHKKDAISVCPFYVSRADIKPNVYIPIWWSLYPPPPEKLRYVYELGYRDALAWVLKNGKLPLGLMGDTNGGGGLNGHAGDGPIAAAAAAERAGGKPAWMRILAESAAEARSCEAEFGEMVLGAGAVLKSMLRCGVWVAICWELALSTLVCAVMMCVAPLAALLSPHVSMQEAWQRLKAVVNTNISPWLLLKTIPAIGPTIRLKRHPQFEQQLREHSFVYRLLVFLL